MIIKTRASDINVGDVILWHFPAMVIDTSKGRRITIRIQYKDKNWKAALLFTENELLEKII